MDEKLRCDLLSEQLAILDAATQVLRESAERVGPLLASGKTALSIEERESCEALTARFSRLCDFLFQRIFRTLDRIELTDDGTAIDRLNRTEKRGIIDSAKLWRELRELRNDIAHEYLIETSDRVLNEAHKHSPELIRTAEKVHQYVIVKGYVK